MKKIQLILFISLLLSGLKIYAQSDAFEININNNQPDFIFNTIADYENGITYPAAVSFSVTAEKGDNWSIYVKSQESAFTTGANSIPLTMLTIHVQGFNARILSTTDQIIASDSPNNKDPETTQYLIDYTVSAPGYTYNPGTYTCTIVYTITVK